jgi:gluconate 2-dehydrogenase gamma chain
MDAPLSRRSLLRASLLAGLSAEVLEALQHAHESAQAGDGKLQYLDPQAAAEIEALAAQIIPSEDGPGAKEAGVVYFIDRALASFDQDQREIYRSGLAAYMTGLAAGRSGLATDRTGLAIEHATGSIAAIEHTEFFQALRRHVVMGFLASPAWGGNRDKVGWKLIGFEDAGAFQPPFGYYDTPGNME